MLRVDLEKIARIEKVTIKGTKEELIKSLGKKVRLKKIREYYSTFLVKRKYDIFKHELVPPHRVMSKDEIKELIKKYGLKSPRQLPRILVTDPAVVAIGGGRGDVIEITRNSKMAGESKYYRLVI